MSGSLVVSIHYIEFGSTPLDSSRNEVYWIFRNFLELSIFAMLLDVQLRWDRFIFTNLQTTMGIDSVLRIYLAWKIRYPIRGIVFKRWKPSLKCAGPCSIRFISVESHSWNSHLPSRWDKIELCDRPLMGTRKETVASPLWFDDVQSNSRFSFLSNERGSKEATCYAHSCKGNFRLWPLPFSALMLFMRRNTGRRSERNNEAAELM